MEAVLAKPHGSVLRSLSESPVVFGFDMSVFDKAIAGDRNFQFRELGTIEELPVLERFDLLVPSQLADRFGTGEKRVRCHIAPCDVTVPSCLAAMDPNPLSIHQLGQHRRSATTALADAEDVGFVRVEAIAESIKIEVLGDDVVIVEQEHVFGSHRINCDVATNSNANIDAGQLDHLTLRSGLRVPGQKATVGLPVVDHDDLRIGDVLTERLDQPVARPRTMDRFDAKRDVGEFDHSFTKC